MDAGAWHRAATAAGAPQPPRLTLDELAALSSAAREDHAGAVRDYLLGMRLAADPLIQLADAISDEVDINALTGPGAKRIVAVTAENTAGKSTLVRTWARVRYRRWVDPLSLASPEIPTWTPEPGMRAHHTPVVWVNLQADTKVKDFDVQVLRFFGYEPRGTIQALTSHMTDALRRHGVRVLVIDDVHWLRTTRVLGRAVLDHLKHVNTEIGEFGATLLLVGANLDGGDIVTDPQVAGRLRMLHLPTFTVDSDGGRLAWQQLLRRSESVLLPYLPAARPGLLANKLAGPIWKRTQGYLGDTAALLLRASAKAAVEGSWTVSRELLATIPLSKRAEEAEARGQRRSGS